MPIFVQVAPCILTLSVCGLSKGVAHSCEIAVSRVTGIESLRTQRGMVVVKVQGEMLVNYITKPEIDIVRILRPCRAGAALIFIVMIINASNCTEPRSQIVIQAQASPPRLCGVSAHRCGRFESIGCDPA